VKVEYVLKLTFLVREEISVSCAVSTHPFSVDEGAFLCFFPGAKGGVRGGKANGVVDVAVIVGGIKEVVLFVFFEDGGAFGDGPGHILRVFPLSFCLDAQGDGGGVDVREVFLEG